MEKKQVELSEHVSIWTHNVSLIQKSEEMNIIEAVIWREKIRFYKKEYE